MVNLYLLGGAGALIGALRPTELPEWVGEHQVFYMDTSRSESKMIPTNANVTIFGEEGQTAGSGGLRGTKAELIKEGMPKFLLQNPPEDFNILIFSGAGASGAMLAYYLADCLMAEKKKVIVLASQASHNLVRATNSLKSLLSLRALTQKHQQSIVGAMYDGSVEGYAKSDRYMVQDLLVLLYFIGADIIGVDESDRLVMLSPERLPDTDYPPGFYSLATIFGTKYDYPFTPMSILTLSEVGGTDDIRSGAPISYSGVIEDGLYQRIFNTTAEEEAVLSLAINNHAFPDTCNVLSKKIQGHKQSADANKPAPSVQLPRGIKLDSTNNDGPIL